MVGGAAADGAASGFTATGGCTATGGAVTIGAAFGVCTVSSDFTTPGSAGGGTATDGSSARAVFADGGRRSAALPELISENFM